MAGEVSVTGGDTEEEGVICREGVGIDDGVIGLRGRVHGSEDRLREGLGNPGKENDQRKVGQRGRIDALEDLGVTASGLDARELSLGHCEE